MPFGNSIELSTTPKIFEGFHPLPSRAIERWKVLPPQPPLIHRQGKFRQFKKLSRNRKKHDTPIKINFIRQIFKTNPPSLLHLIPKGENHFSSRRLRTYHGRRMASVGILEHESLLNTLRRDQQQKKRKLASDFERIPLRINSRRAAHKFWQLLERNNSPSRLELWRRNEHPNRCPPRHR